MLRVRSWPPRSRHPRPAPDQARSKHSLRRSRRSRAVGFPPVPVPRQARASPARRRVRKNASSFQRHVNVDHKLVLRRLQRIGDVLFDKSVLGFELLLADRSDCGHPAPRVVRVVSHEWALAPVDATAGTEPVTQPRGPRGSRSVTTSCTRASVPS